MLPNDFMHLGLAQKSGKHLAYYRTWLHLPFGENSKGLIRYILVNEFLH